MATLGKILSYQRRCEHAGDSAKYSGYNGFFSFLYKAFILPVWSFHRFQGLFFIDSVPSKHHVKRIDSHKMYKIKIVDVPIRSIRRKNFNRLNFSLDNK